MNIQFLAGTLPTGMRAGTFIIQKYQLPKQLHPNNNDNESSPYIIGVLNHKLMPLVKVVQSRSFEELRKMVRQLEEEHKIESRAEDNVR